MTLEAIQERRQKLEADLQRATEQRDRLRHAAEEATIMCERMRGAMMLLDDMIATETPMPETPVLVPEEVRAA